mmetsp:Transcript_24765/g.74536  ORF Transcript_24765/g.74536 Transcript_24765/m.74536 type:complete len:973 (+) Transcript_24765:189-3107(+)
MLAKGLCDSNSINWWRALAVGFMSIGSSGGRRRLGEALREFNFLKLKHGLELPSAVALVFFHKSAERVDHEELDILWKLVAKENERASGASLLLSAQFHLYSGIHAGDRDLACEQFELSRSLIRKVVQADQSTLSAIQKQARVLWAWVEILPLADSWQERGLEALRHIDGAAGGSTSNADTLAWDLEGLLVRARYYELVKQHARALDCLNQAVALRSWEPALLEKTKLLISQGDWDQAADTTQRILQQNERSMDGLRLNVLIHMVQKTDGQATEERLLLMIKSMERYEGSNAALFFNTAQTLSRLSSRKAEIVKLTIGLCKKAIELEPCAAAYLVELAREKVMLYDYEGAMQTYRKAGRSDESHIPALYGTIYIHIMLGELDDAEQQLDFLEAISESIEQSSQLPYLKALLAWRHRRDAAEHVRFLQQAEQTHLKFLDKQSTPKIFTRFAKLDPDFLIALSEEYLLHVQFVDLTTSSQSSSINQNSAVRHGIDILTRVSEELPGHVGAHLLLGRAQLALGELNAATVTVSTALDCDSRSASGHLLSSQLALAKSNHRAAAIALDQAAACDFEIRRTPAYALVKAKLCSFKGDPGEALKILQDAMQFPGLRDERATGTLIAVPVVERVAVFVELAEVLSELSRVEEAANVLAEAQERFQGTSEEIRILMSSSMLAIKRDEFETALHMLDAVPHSSPVYSHVQEFKANLHLSIRHDKHSFVQCYRDLVDLSKNAHSYERLGAAYLHIQAPEPAVAAYEQAHRLNPEDSSLAMKIGHALVSTHDYLKATDYYVTALQAHADNIGLRHDLARLFMKLEKYGNATQVLLYALEPVGLSSEVNKIAQDVQSLLLLAQVYACADRGTKDIFEDGMFVAEHSVSGALLKARDLQRIVLEKVQSALESTEIICKEKRIMAEICCKLATCYLNEGKMDDKAMAAYEEALKADNVRETPPLDWIKSCLRRPMKAACCKSLDFG